MTYDSSPQVMMKEAPRFLDVLNADPVSSVVSTLSGYYEFLIAPIAPSLIFLGWLDSPIGICRSFHCFAKVVAFCWVEVICFYREEESGGGGMEATRRLSLTWVGRRRGAVWHIQGRYIHHLQRSKDNVILSQQLG